MWVPGSLDKLVIITSLTLLVVLGVMLVALLVILLCRPHARPRALKDLRAAVVPFVLALSLWVLLRWPSSNPWDLIMLFSILTLLALSLAALARFIVRSVRLR